MTSPSKKISAPASNLSKDILLPAIIKTVRESLLVLNKDLRIEFANRAFYKAFRGTPRATEKKLIYEIGDGQWNIPELKTLLKKILSQGGSLESFEIDHKFPSIGRKIMLLSARKLYDRTKAREPMILLIIEDITRRKKLEDDLADYSSGLEEKIIERTKSIALEKARTEAILQSLGDGLVVFIDINKGGRITYVNRAFEEMTGWKAQEVIDRDVTDVIPREDENGRIVPMKERLVTKILSGEKIVVDMTRPFYYIRKDKSKFPAASIITPILLNKKIIGAVETFRDITKECAADKVKTEFVSLVSHQLRAPFSAINWCIEMLLSGDLGRLNEKQVQFLREAHHTSMRMASLIGALLTVSRIETGATKIKTKPIDAVSLSEKVLKENEMEIQKKKLKIEKIYGKNIPPIQVSNGQLNIIFQNLISNAIKYTPDGGKINLNIGFKEGSVTIAISNAGIGIPQDDQPKIFTRFFRADNAKKQDSEGSGLGLYIVKTIVDQMGGKIWFKSQRNRRTTFYVTLPVAVKPK